MTPSDTKAAGGSGRDAEAFDFLVRRDDLHVTKIAPAPSEQGRELQAGQVLARLETFALTTNNITYAVFGDTMSYWEFFPAPEGWGRVPVWGFAEIVRSRHERIGEGQRFFGYFPVSTHLVLQPEAASASGFTDATPHRRQLPAVYNNYVAVGADPTFADSDEARQAVFRPLFTTSFLIDDFMADNKYFAAREILISSASSKTAIGVAYLLSRRDAGRPRVVGLTSAANKGFVERLGCYDEVILYDEVRRRDAAVATVLIDIAGNSAVVAAVHEHFAASLAYSCQVGGTHWQEIAAPAPLSGPSPVLFFAPAQIEKRSKDWGPVELQKRLAAAWSSFLEPAMQWIAIVEGCGPADIERVYREMLDGKANPGRAHVLSPGARG